MPEKRLRLISRWKEIVAKAAEAIKKVYPDAEVYLFGGAAEGRLTVASDIDIAVVFEDPPENRGDVLAKIWEVLEEEGVPPYYPLEVHILSREEFEKLKGSKVRLA
ncbi:MAG: nucleotidyltransferase domain-containing protein [Sulfolobales archaeon]